VFLCLFSVSELLPLLTKDNTNGIIHYLFKNKKKITHDNNTLSMQDRIDDNDTINISDTESFVETEIIDIQSDISDIDINETTFLLEKIKKNVKINKNSINTQTENQIKIQKETQTETQTNLQNEHVIKIHTDELHKKITSITTLNELENMLIEIKKEMSNMKEQLSFIETSLDKINSSTKNMDEHISFVENVFVLVKKPFSNILKWYDRDMEVPDMERLIGN
jgi:hypothetical protein